MLTPDITLSVQILISHHVNATLRFRVSIVSYIDAMDVPVLT